MRQSRANASEQTEFINTSMGHALFVLQGLLQMWQSGEQIKALKRTDQSMNCAATS
jgi:hypothetical protein